MGSLLRGSRKGGALTHAGMESTAVSKRVTALARKIALKEAGNKEDAKQLDIWRLSAHDCRHYWATRAVKRNTDLFRLQEAGGWNSLVMPRRYVEAAEIANQGMV